MGTVVRFAGALFLIGMFILGVMYGAGFYRDVIQGHQDPGYYTKHFVERMTGARQPDEIREAGRKFRTELNREAAVSR